MNKLEYISLNNSIS